MAKWQRDPLPADLAGTYLGAIPERENLNLIRHMARFYEFRGYNCEGVRVNFPSGWTRHSDLAYVTHGRLSGRITTKHTIVIKIHQWLDAEHPDDLCYNIILHETRMDRETRKDGSIHEAPGDSYGYGHCHMNLRMSGDRCVEFSCRDVSACYQDFVFTFDEVAELLCPAEYPGYYPYSSSYASAYREILGVLYKCRYIHDADGTIQYLDLTTAEGKMHYLIIDARFAPYVAGGYRWSSANHTGIINLFPTGTEFTCRQVPPITAVPPGPDRKMIRDLIAAAHLTTGSIFFTYKLIYRPGKWRSSGTSPGPT